MSIDPNFGMPVLSDKEKDMISSELDPLLAKRLAAGEDLLEAVLTIFEEARDFELEHKGITPACQRGCQICCQQTFPVTRFEFDAMMRGYEILGRRDKYTVQKKAKRLIAHWQQFLKKKGRFGHREVADLDSFKWMVLEFNRTYSVSCPFFSDDSQCCLIYAARPFECRACISSLLCNEEGGNPVYFVSDFWPGTVLAKHEMEVYGEVTFHPLAHWLSGAQLL